MTSKKLIESFVEEFNKEINKVPDGFYDTFKYTKTGNNLTHPRTLGYIIKAILRLRNDTAIEIDRRFNEDKTKFQPDIYVTLTDDKPFLVVDYESPNSSDARILDKDVKPYLEWVKSHGYSNAPYIIITTLPTNRRSTGEWELRYTSKGQCNEDHKGKLKEIRDNPFEYWYGNVYEQYLQQHKDILDKVYFINISGKEAVLIEVS